MNTKSLVLRLLPLILFSFIIIVSGLVLYELANIPEKNLKLKIDGFTFVVEEVTDRRIETIIVYIK